MINKLAKLAVTATLLMTPIMFTGCSDNNEVGRDRNVPNNIEDNYTGDADHNRTSEKNQTNENEEESRMKMNSTTSMMNSNTINRDEKSVLEARIDKLEKEVMQLKSAKKGSDIVGQK